MANLTAKDLYSYLAIISPQEYSSLPRSSKDLKPFLNTTVEAGHNAISSIPPHPSLSADNSLTDLQKLYKSVKPPASPPPPGAMALWKLPAKDGKGAWFARKSIHEDITFDRFKRALEVEFALEENGLSGTKGTEKQLVPGGGVESVRGIGCVQRVTEKLAEDGCGEMEIVRLAAQFPGPTAAREFVVLCCRKGGFDVTGGAGRWYMAVSRPVVPGQGGELQEICPGREAEGYIRGEYESVEFIRELVPEGEDEGCELEAQEEVEDYTPDEVEAEVEGLAQEEKLDTKENKHHKKKHRRHLLHHKSSDKELISEGTVDESPVSDISPALSTSSSPDRSKQRLPPRRKDYPVEWVMLSRSDPGGNVPRWMVERGTPGSIVKDAEKFLQWLRNLSDEQLGIQVTQSPDDGKTGVLSNGKVVQEVYPAAAATKVVDQSTSMDSLDSDIAQEKEISSPENNNQANDQGGLASSVFGLAAGVASYIPTMKITNILGTNGDPSSKDPVSDDDQLSPLPQRPSAPRLSTDAASIQSFSTAVQHPDSPPLTPTSTSVGADDAPLTPTSTSSTISGSLGTNNAVPDASSGSSTNAIAESKPLARLLSQKTRLLSRFEKALQKNRKGEDVERKLRERYEAEVRREEERYKRDMEKVGRRREKEAQKQKEREAKEREREVKEKEREKERGRQQEEKRKRAGSAASQVVKEAREVVERLTKENERLARENEELRERLEMVVEAAGLGGSEEVIGVKKGSERMSR